MVQSLLRKFAHAWIQYIHPRLSSFVAAANILWLGVCLLSLYVVGQLADEVLEQEAFAFDTTILLWINQISNPVLDRVMLSITQLGNPTIATTVTVVSFLVLWLRHYRLEAKMFAINCLGGATLSTGLKLAFSKVRPQLWPQLIQETTYSFPSGHALGSIVLYGFLAYLLAQHYRQYVKLIYSLTTVLIVAIGLSRLYLGVHWPTDVIAGYGIGFLWITVGIALLRLQQRRKSGILAP
ncbi:phosphatase PAP2 family protein [Pseudanabaena sp. FACHB-2040]|uniref:phosphatase PAP2 family protein n=1 Tax=Pseudanabaena sp. FACHB-2040 TaxID=2692859 RepID=UPI0016854B1A|nr:phosphatase PAP2 family protein [Pseudanabaena sp. FACHB-2040]MBD2259747.1 phosphatase PAP2 family protein [Pseudanabaena sp. FACHB-2040]